MNTIKREWHRRPKYSATAMHTSITGRDLIRNKYVDVNGSLVNKATAKILNLILISFHFRTIG